MIPELDRISPLLLPPVNEPDPQHGEPRPRAPDRSSTPDRVSTLSGSVANAAVAKRAARPPHFSDPASIRASTGRASSASRWCMGSPAASAMSMKV